MTRPLKKVLSGDYKVGYGRPPSETRFRKGVCGNPGGRPRGMTAGRAKRLALQEAYRPITVREGDAVFTLPTIQAVMRQQGCDISSTGSTRSSRRRCKQRQQQPKASHILA